MRTNFVTTQVASRAGMLPWATAARSHDTLVVPPMGSENAGRIDDAFSTHWRHDMSVVAPYKAQSSLSQGIRDVL